MMHKGVMAPPLSRAVRSGLFLLLSLAAPGQSGTLRDEETSDGLANPFQSGDKSHRLLQSYTDSIVNAEEQQGRPEINSREQEVFFLFRHHDYDHSGFLDGLEMIKLLSDYNTFYKPAVVYHYNQVESLVDFLLQTQDLNRDGLFTPSELLSPPLLQKQQEEVAEDPSEGAQNEVQMETQPRQEEQTEAMAAPGQQGQPEI